MQRHFLAGIVTVFLVAACAQVPKESIQLSEDVGGVLEELRQKNANLVGQLFSDRKARVNVFVDEVYAPAVVADAMKRTDAVEKLSGFVTSGEGDKALEMMKIMVGLSINRIEKTRKELLEPIEAQERKVKDAFDAAFGVAIKGTETTTGLLKSVREVHLAQEETLGSVGIRNLRETVNTEVATVSHRLGAILAEAEDFDAQLEALTRGELEGKEPTLEELKGVVASLKELFEAASAREN